MSYNLVVCRKSGLGAAVASGLSYAEQTASIVKDVTDDPTMLAQLSPYVKLTTQVMRLAIDQVESVGGHALEDILGTATGQAMAEAASKLGTSTIADLSSAVGSVGAAAAGVLPFVNVAATLFAQAASDAARWKQAAQNTYVEECTTPSPIPTGQGQAVPVDLFVLDTTMNRWLSQHGLVPGVVRPSSQSAGACKSSDGTMVPAPGGGMMCPPQDFARPGVGDALITVTEGDPGDLARARQFYGAPNLGITPTTQDLFMRMRLAIDATFATPTLDGGAAVWPLYIDTLRSAFVSGRMNASYAGYKIVLNDALYTNGDSQLTRDNAAWALDTNKYINLFDNICAKWLTQPWQAVIQLVIQWGYIVDPQHSQGLAALAAIEAQLLAEAKKFMQQKLVLKPGSLTSLPRLTLGSKPKPNVVTTPQFPYGPVILGAVGLTAVAGGVLLMRRRRRAS